MFGQTNSVPRRGPSARRGLGVLALVSVGSLALTACGGGGDAPDSGSGPDGGVPQEIVIGMSADVDNLNPWTATHYSSVEILTLLYGTLTELDESLEVVPGLAEDWETSEDGLTVTFNLREGVTFADGSDLDAEDVVASYNAIQDEDTAAVSRTYLSTVEAVEAVDTHTVELTLTSPDSAIFSKLAVSGTAILPSDVDVDAIQTEPNGTGAFLLESRTPSESITLVSNPNFWGGEPLLDRVEYRIIPDDQAVVSALQAGNVQMATFDDPLVAQTIGGSVNVIETPKLDYQVLQINNGAEPLDDVNVRLALACAVDREQVLESAALGAGDVTGPITSPAYRSDPSDRPCPEPDLDRARDYLAEAGYADGLTLSIIVMRDGYPSTAVAQTENLQAQLEQIGVTLNIEALESGQYVERWLDADFELALALNGSQPDPGISYERYFLPDGSLNSVAGYTSETLEDLFAQAREETDEVARAQIFAEVSAELENEAVWVWLFAPYEYTALADEVNDFTPMANGSVRSLRTAYIE